MLAHVTFTTTRTRQVLLLPHYSEMATEGALHGVYGGRLHAFGFSAGTVLHICMVSFGAGAGAGGAKEREADICAQEGGVQ